MADPLYELLAPYFDNNASPRPLPSISNSTTTKYLNRLSTLPLSSLTTTEPQSLAQATYTTLLSLQSLSARSTTALVTSSTHLSTLRTSLPQIASSAHQLRHDIPNLDTTAVSFSEKYSRSAGSENEVLDRRKRALLMSRNVDRISDILDLPTLLASAIASANAQGTSTTGGASTTNYASALDLYSHIKRLHLLYQSSPLITSIYAQAEEAMQAMTSNLITSLRTQNIKLAAAMRTIGWLRRVAPDLDSTPGGNREGFLGALFLVCRLATLVSMLSALEPLRDLADQESQIRERERREGLRKEVRDAWSGGQQTERYLKRYVEVFREQSFGIVSMFKSIFPEERDSTTSLDDLGPRFKSLGLKSLSANNATVANNTRLVQHDPLTPIPSALATFPIHLVSLLTETLRQYLPNVRDKSSRESLLTQVLYCAGSLGRLGGDFSLLLAGLGGGGRGRGRGKGEGNGGEENEGGGEKADESDEESEDDGEWVEMMKKHRVLAGKLESLASGGSLRGGKGGGEGVK